MFQTSRILGSRLNPVVPYKWSIMSLLQRLLAQRQNQKVATEKSQHAPPCQSEESKSCLSVRLKACIRSRVSVAGQTTSRHIDRNSAGQTARVTVAGQTAKRKAGASSSVAKKDAAVAPPAKRQRTSHTDMDFLGSSSESRTDHLARHGGGRRDCGRCRFYMWGAKWMKAYGQVPALHQPKGRSGGREVMHWLAERPARWPGAWGLGCALCAGFYSRVKASDDGRPDASRFGTKWARYEVRVGTLQASHVHQHLGKDCHRLATEAYLQPDAPIRMVLQCEHGDEELLRGAVPQPPDWLRAFRSVQSPEAFRAAEEHQETEHYIRAIRARPVLRRAVKSQIAVMAEVIRCVKRRWIRDASSITISLDDKKPHRFIRFKADCLTHLPRKRDGSASETGHDRSGAGQTALRHSGAGQTALRQEGGDDRIELQGASTYPHPGACSGVLGVIRPHHSADVETFDEDASQRVCDTILTSIRTFCTPYASPCDEGLAQHFLNSVRVFMADGGSDVQKCGKLLSRQCPNLLVVGRDPTHAVRIGCAQPLSREDRFKEQWDRLFDGPHAVIARIQYSEDLRARLAACQRRVLRVDGEQGGGLTAVLKHFAFVKPRFESFVGPRRKYICLLQAITMLLCSIADDKRQEKSKREHAVAALDAITPADVIACGLAADYSEICLSFIRKFDVSNHDPALSMAQKEHFLNTLKVVFLDGFVFAQPEGGQSPECSFSGGRVRAKLLTHIAFEQMLQSRVFYYGDRMKVLWSGSARPDAEKALKSMQHVVKEASRRVNVDLHARDTLMWLEVFNLAAWVECRAQVRNLAIRQTGLARTSQLLKKLHRLAVELKLDADATVSQFEAALPLALQERRALMREQERERTDGVEVTDVDNRTVWATLLEAQHRQKFPSLSRVVQFYMSVLDSTGLLERGLGQVMEVCSAHSGSLDEAARTTDDIVTVYLDGPKFESELFTRADDGTLTFTPLSRACAQHWLVRHGRRFSCTQRQRKNSGARNTGWRLAGTDRAVQAGQHKATTLLMALAARKGKQAVTLFEDTVQNYTENHTRTPKSLKKFRDATKKTAAVRRARACASPADRIKVPALRRGGTLAQPVAPRVRTATHPAKNLRRQLQEQRQDPATIFVLGDPLAPNVAAGFQVRVATASLHTADLVVVPKLTDLDTVDMDARALLVWLTVIMRGMSLIARQDVTSATRTDSARCLRHQAGTRFKQHVGIKADFARAQPRIVSAMQKQSAMKTSNWHVTIGDEWRKSDGVDVISSLTTLQSFLRRARRLQPGARSQHGTYCRRAAVGMSV